MNKSMTKTQAKNKAIQLLQLFKDKGYSTELTQEEIEKVLLDSDGENYNIKVTKQENLCKYCGEPTYHDNEDVLCTDCRLTFGHTFYSEL